MGGRDLADILADSGPEGVWRLLHDPDAVEPLPAPTDDVIGGDSPALADLTDAGNARSLAAEHGADLRFTLAHGWLTWDGARWTADETAEVERRAKAIARDLYTEAGRLSNLAGMAELAETRNELSARAKRLLEWAKKSESERAISAMVKLARSESPIRVRAGDLGGKSYLLNCRNGTVDLRIGELREHRREDLITKVCPVDFDPAAESEAWSAFLADATGSDGELAAFVRRAIGYSLLGDPVQDALMLMFGPTASGKSTFVAAINAALGDYALTLDFSSLLKRPHGRDASGPSPDLARLQGARFVSSLEVDEGKTLAEGLVKMLTGSDRIAARDLYKGLVEFRLEGVLWLAVNHRPKVSPHDAAIWRRIFPIGFLHSVPESRRDPMLRKRLADPALTGAAVLAWAVEGAREFLALRDENGDGLRPPASVLGWREEYRVEVDDFADFFADECRFESGAIAATGDLWKRYEEHCQATGNEPRSRHALAKALKGHGAESARVGSQRRWAGVRLLSDADRTTEHMEP